MKYTSKLFPKYEIDLDNGLVYSITQNRQIGSKSKDGYYECNVFDIYGNHYKRNHEVILAEGLQLPKHKWPIDEKGNRFVVDHIKPVSKGGTDMFNNLRLGSNKDNANNESTIESMSKVRKGKPLPQFRTKESIEKAAKSKWKQVDQIDPITGEIVNQWNSAKEASIKCGFTRSEITACCNGGRMHYGKWNVQKIHKGYMWKRPL